MEISLWKNAINDQARACAQTERMNNPTDTSTKDSGVSHLEAVRSRIEYKMRDYRTYKFTPSQSYALNIFFDLAQEFENSEHLHVLSVLILRMFFDYEAELYLKDDQSEPALVTPPVDSGIPRPPPVRPECWNENGRYYFPVRGRHSLVLSMSQRLVTDENIIGVLVVYTGDALESHDLLFLNKFANRLGYALHNKILAERNARHILFLRKLAHDIGHNIITPNLRLKFQLQQLNRQIDSLKAVISHPADEATVQDIRILQRRMADQIKDIAGNFQNSALFLESLLRQSHSDVGHYVLRRSRLDISAAVVAPQFERYRPHFEERGILIRDDQPSLPPVPCLVQADLGLISQVVANFLSNAVKYCTPVHEDEPGEVRCSVKIIPKAFVSAADGVKVSVFSTGPNIPAEEAKLLFEDNYRASNSSGQYGTGHGLFFVREIIAEHTGLTGYEPLPDGNSFYFILPLVE